MLADIFGPDILIVVLIVVVLLFGGAAIPKLAKNLGSAKKEFEKGLSEGASTDTSNPNASSTPPASDTPVQDVSPNSPNSPNSK